jgi:hypothetical protein
MICEMMGVPAEDWPRMRFWSDRMVGWDDPDMGVTPEMGVQAAMEMFAYCDDLVAKRMADPTDDILSTLCHADVDGDRLTPMELDMFFVTLVIAGNETTRNLISHGMLALFDHPEQRERLEANPDLMPTAVDEMLRWGSSIQNFRRTATRDTQVRGVPIAAGDKLVTFYLSGNFDEDVYDAPMSSAWTGPTTTTSRSGVAASTSASAPTWPRRRSAPRSARYCAACRTSDWPANPLACSPTSSTASSACRCSSPSNGPAPWPDRPRRALRACRDHQTSASAAAAMNTSAR